MAGVYFTFSAFVMRSLDEIDAPMGMTAMQSINKVIVKSTFLPIFFASTIACAAMAVIALLDLTAVGARWMLAGSVTYVVGMFMVTVARNVPLNNKLEATIAAGPDGPAMWAQYMAKWTVWNNVRTLACTLAMILLIIAIHARA
jgi:uncharacterized membrane protein